ncbi:MAG: ECF transporter S component [Bacillota bacterium]|nr:ECF transporter S component [Bacillota bacterium]
MKTTTAIAYGAVLTALAIMIPISFGGFLGVYIPPFSATLASHVPLMLGMAISPLVAVAVGLGSAIGFLLKLGPVIGARAAMHAVVGFTGATLVKKGMAFPLVLLAMAPLHGLLEAFIVVPFGFNLYRAGVVVGIGTVLHHLVDSGITLAILPLLRGAGLLANVRTRSS